MPFSEITLSIPLADQGIYFDIEIRRIEDLQIVFRDIADLDFRGKDDLLGEGVDMHNSEVFLLHISICILFFTMSSICINLRFRFAYKI